jgi:hypothetical protein
MHEVGASTPSAALSQPPTSSNATTASALQLDPDAGQTTGGSGGGEHSSGSQDDVEFVVLNDDVLTSVSNATLVLLDGSDLERMAVLYQFPQFLEHCPDETLSIMVPEIGAYAVSWKEDVQMAAAEALYFVVNMTVPEEVAKRIVVAALRIIQESESGEVFDAWGEILSMMLPQVKRADVQSLVVPATVSRASSQTVESRRLAARIIGSLNDTLTAEELEQKFLRQALRLCEDKDPSVRAMIAQSLASLGTKLPLVVSEKHLWPKLNALMDDENPRVRAAAMRAVARTAEAHKQHCRSSPSFRSLLLPVFLRECATASEVAATDLRTVDDDTYLMLEIFSEVYGYFLFAVSPLFASEETWTTALNSLRRMVTCNGPTVRHWCAFNVPAVAQVCSKARPEKIRGVVQALSSDTDVETRATLAAGIHETTTLLAEGPLREEMLGAIAVLMNDQNPQVRMNSLGHFASILSVLADSSPQILIPPTGASAESQNGKTGMIVSSKSRQLGPIVSSLETMSHDSWRTQKLLAEQLEKSAKLIPQDMLCEHVAPLLFQMARESTYLVRKASMSALVSVIRFIPDVRRRDHILKHFRSEWARGKVYWTRLAYIDASEVALRLLSNKLFTQLFAAELFTLARDPVANVRVRLARLMPDLSVACGSKTAFLNAMEALLSDKEDRDVAYEALAAKKAITRKPPRSSAAVAEDTKKESAEKIFFIQRQKRKSTAPAGPSPANVTIPPRASAPLSSSTAPSIGASNGTVSAITSSFGAAAGSAAGVVGKSGSASVTSAASAKDGSTSSGVEAEQREPRFVTQDRRNATVGSNPPAKKMGSEKLSSGSNGPEILSAPTSSSTASAGNVIARPGGDSSAGPISSSGRRTGRSTPGSQSGPKPSSSSSPTSDLSVAEPVHLTDNKQSSSRSAKKSFCCFG